MGRERECKGDAADKERNLKITEREREKEREKEDKYSHSAAVDRIDVKK